jgi:hypothetical protein
MALSVGILSAAERFGTIIKVDGNTITFVDLKKKVFEEQKKYNFAKGEAKTYTVAKDAKIMKGGVKGGKGGGEPTPLEGGLSNELFKDIPDFGRFAQITTNDKNEVTEIRVAAFGGKGGKKKDGGN